jgi:hypothetical protein
VVCLVGGKLSPMILMPNILFLSGDLNREIKKKCSMIKMYR